MINIENVIRKIDEHLHANDYEGAEKVLAYWLEEARQTDDKRALLPLCNEQMGLMRKLARRDDAASAAYEALNLIEELDLDDTLAAATTYVNAATVFKAFDRSAEAIPIFEKAGVIFEAAVSEGDVDAGDMRLGSFYNNMALALADEKRYDDAMAAYEKALAVMGKAEFGGQEQAITYLNMADLVYEMDGEGADDGGHVLDDWMAHFHDAELELKALEFVGKAKELLEDPEIPRDGYHAFVLEKCAPSFSFYGFNEIAEGLKARAIAIYEENQ